MKLVDIFVAIVLFVVVYILTAAIGVYLAGEISYPLEWSIITRMMHLYITTCAWLGLMAYIHIEKE